MSREWERHKVGGVLGASDVFKNPVTWVHPFCEN